MAFSSLAGKLQQLLLKARLLPEVQLREALVSLEALLEGFLKAAEKDDTSQKEAEVTQDQKAIQNLLTWSR